VSLRIIPARKRGSLGRTMINWRKLLQEQHNTSEGPPVQRSKLSLRRSDCRTTRALAKTGSQVSGTRRKMKQHRRQRLPHAPIGE
jgi:hypothetical protein